MLWSLLSAEAPCGRERVDDRGDVRGLRHVGGRFVDRVRVLRFGQLAAVGVQDDRARPVGLVGERLGERVGRALAVGARQRQVVVRVFAQPVGDGDQRDRQPRARRRARRSGAERRTAPVRTAPRSSPATPPRVSVDEPRHPPVPVAGCQASRCELSRACRCTPPPALASCGRGEHHRPRASTRPICSAYASVGSRRAGARPADRRSDLEGRDRGHAAAAPPPDAARLRASPRERARARLAARRSGRRRGGGSGQLRHRPGTPPPCRSRAWRRS